MARVTIRKKGKRPLSFKRGGLHESLGVPQGQPIPPGKKAAALRGEYGPKAKKQAVFAFKGALATGRETVAGRAKPRKRPRRNSPTRASALRMSDAQLDRQLGKGKMRFRY